MSVRSYYDSNTWKFLIAGSQGAIHRELWAPGIARKKEAMHHAHALVVDEVRAIVERKRGGPTRVLDLGCGVGATTQYVAERLPVEALGVSISPVQIRTARRWLRLRRKSLAGNCAFREADFCALPPDLVGFDLAFAIEAFVHAPDPAAFFRNVAGALRLGGRLILIDDFLDGAARSSPRDRQVLDEVRRGWHMGSLLTVAQADALARTHGLRRLRADDLSPWQRLGRPRDRLIHAALPLLRLGALYSHWCESLVGGDALQTAHKRGLVQYRLVVFERADG